MEKLVIGAKTFDIEILLLVLDLALTSLDTNLS
jgi:hypothetical protein